MSNSSHSMAESGRCGRNHTSALVEVGATTRASMPKNKGIAARRSRFVSTMLPPVRSSTGSTRSEVREHDTLLTAEEYDRLKHFIAAHRAPRTPQLAAPPILR